MTRFIALLAFLPVIAFAQLLGEGTHRSTFQGVDTVNRTVACKSAKDQANAWLDRNQNLSVIYTTTTGQGECGCDKGNDLVETKFCYVGTPDCRSDGTRLVSSPRPWVCTVDASVTNRKK
jgi:hypothetical protein